MVFKTNYRLMQVKSIAECSKGTLIKLAVVIKIFVFFIFLSACFKQVLLFLGHKIDFE